MTTTDPTLTANRVISTAEAAELLGVSEDTFRRMAARKEAPAIIKLSARRVGVRLRDLSAWLDKRAAAAT
jgi:excisionase family DNA binding protein